MDGWLEVEGGVEVGVLVVVSMVCVKLVKCWCIVLGEVLLLNDCCRLIRLVVSLFCYCVCLLVVCVW